MRWILGRGTGAVSFRPTKKGYLLLRSRRCLQCAASPWDRARGLTARFPVIIADGHKAYFSCIGFDLCLLTRSSLNRPNRYKNYNHHQPLYGAKPLAAESCITSQKPATHSSKPSGPGNSATAYWYPWFCLSQ